MKKQVLSLCLAVARCFVVIGGLSVITSSASAGEVAVARYSTIRPVPTLEQRDPLAGLVKKNFSNSVTLVGQAVDALLEPTGYRLASARAAPPARAMLFALPLPAAHRALGPMPLRLALTTLAGSAFVLVEDPVHRLVSFERCEAARGER
jgi:type IV pili sensor histidine kinase/response regulator